MSQPSAQQRWDQRYRQRPAVWSAAPHPQIANCLRQLPAGQALDLGCGEGRHSRWLAERGWQVLGVDFSAVAIDRARSLASCSAANFMVHDLGHWTPPPATFDLVLISFLHTGPEDRACWWPAAVAAVRPGGTLCYLGHAQENITHGVGGPQDPDLLPTLAALSTELSGWRRSHSAVIARPAAADPGHTHPDDGDQQALDALLIAHRPHPEPTAPAQGF